MIIHRKRRPFPASASFSGVGPVVALHAQFGDLARDASLQGRAREKTQQLIFALGENRSAKRGENGEKWEEKVGEFAENLQEIIAKGGLENWIKAEIAKEEV